MGALDRESGLRCLVGQVIAALGKAIRGSGCVNRGISSSSQEWVNRVRGRTEPSVLILWHKRNQKPTLGYGIDSSQVGLLKIRGTGYHSRYQQQKEETHANSNNAFSVVSDDIIVYHSWGASRVCDAMWSMRIPKGRTQAQIIINCRGENHGRENFSEEVVRIVHDECTSLT